MSIYHLYIVVCVVSNSDYYNIYLYSLLILYFLYFELSWVKKKHPIIEPAVRIPKKGNNNYRSMSVLPYLFEHHNGGILLDDYEDDVGIDLVEGRGVIVHSDSPHRIDPEDGFDVDEEDFEQFAAQLRADGINVISPGKGGGSSGCGIEYSSSGGSISRINELTVHSMVSNTSKASKSSKTSTKCKFFVFNKKI